MVEFLNSAHSTLLPSGYSFRKSRDEGSPECGMDEVIYNESLNLPLWGSNGGLDLSTGKFFERPGSFFALLHEIGHAYIIASLSDEQFTRLMPWGQGKTYAIARLQDERDASAYALNKIHELRKEGIDLEPEITTKEQLKWLIYGPLASQEIREVKKLEGIGAKLWVKRRTKQFEKTILKGNLTDLTKGSIRPIRRFEPNQISILGCLWGILKP